MRCADQMGMMTMSRRNTYMVMSSNAINFIAQAISCKRVCINIIDSGRHENIISKDIMKRSQSETKTYHTGMLLGKLKKLVEFE